MIRFTRARIVFTTAFIIFGIVAAYMIIYQPFKIAIKSDNSLSFIDLPDGFGIEVFAENLGGSPISSPGVNPGPRFMLIKGDAVFVTITNQGKIVALRDTDLNGKSDKIKTSIDGLKNPHGIDFHEGWFYIAEENRVFRVQDSNNDLIFEKDSMENLVDLPSGEGHFTRTLKVHDGSLYISVGSSCNACIEKDDKRAKILKCNLDGSNCVTFASGLRNAVGFVFHPETGKMYATENGRDWLGNDNPPDEINLIDGGDYGWPICYGKNIHDTEFDKNVYIQNPCNNKKPSLVDLQAHSAPLGLAVYNGESFPEEYKGDLFVAYHGSWNRDDPTGYKIVSIDLNDLSVKDFATGWLQKDNVLGRPVDIIVAGEGSIFVSDDNAGKIYRIYYSG